jgi:hypothetical protein
MWGGEERGGGSKRERMQEREREEERKDPREDPREGGRIQERERERVNSTQKITLNRRELP